jgi:ubiquinone/menaquinone biosynthesis C-methylase UbiE
MKHSDAPVKELAPEEVRIKQAYARRLRTVPATRYSCFNSGNLMIEQELERGFLYEFRRQKGVSLRDQRILEIGCGTGARLRSLIQWGAQPENLVGVDLIEERVTEARRLLPQAVTIVRGSASSLEFSDCSFDVVCQFTLFSSVLDGQVKQRIGQEMLRVLKPDGCLIWYDFRVNNPLNSDVRGIGKTEIGQLFPECTITFRRLTLLPPLARFLGNFSPAACQIISATRLLSTHYLAFITKPSAA